MSSIVMLTCPRDGDEPWPYLRATLAGVDAEDLPGVKKCVVVDGELPDFAGAFSAWSWSTFASPATRLKGNKLPYWHCFDVAREASRGSALVLEDDLAFCRNALRRMVTLPIPGDLAWLQFFSPHILQTATMVPGVWRPPAAHIGFGQAIKFTPATLAALVDWRETDREFNKFQESDNALGLAAQRLGLRYGVHSPDLVQHVGEVSKANPDDDLSATRVSKGWPGPNFDALSLYMRDDVYR